MPGERFTLGGRRLYVALHVHGIRSLFVFGFEPSFARVQSVQGLASRERLATPQAPAISSTASSASWASQHHGNRAAVRRAQEDRPHDQEGGVWSVGDRPRLARDIGSAACLHGLSSDAL